MEILRNVTTGIHPEIEIGRFLADVAHFPNVPTLLGTLGSREGDHRTALAVVHACIENQGDAWSITSAALDRFIEEQRLLTEEAVAENLETASMLQRMRQIGTPHRRVASRSRRARRYRRLRARADFGGRHRTLDRCAGSARARSVRLAGAQSENPCRAGGNAPQRLSQRDAIGRHIEAGRSARYEGLKIRHHGNFHLGQVLIAKDDAYILDFEGEPGRPLEQRRSKEPPARDVAGLLRSIDYATSAALNRAPNLTPEERAALARRIRAWREKLTAAYWESYRETLGNAGLWPAVWTRHEACSIFSCSRRHSARSNTN